MVELAAELLRRTGRLRLCVTGSSMLPAIRPGDLIEIRASHADTVQAGMVVVFERSGRLFAHRAVRREGAAVVTRGDTLPFDDATIAGGQFLGEVVEVWRGERRVDARATAFTRAAAFVFRRSSLAGRLFTRLFAA